MQYMTRQIILMTIVSASLVSVACAAAAPQDQGGSLLLTLFIGFFALIVVFQLVPACILFIGMLRGLFSRELKSGKKESQI